MTSPGTRWEREDSIPSSESQVLAGGSAEDKNLPAVDSSLAMRSGDGEALKNWASITTTILNHLRGFEVRLLWVDYDAQLPAEVEDHLKVGEERVA